ncbi:hypothetical protein P691DRAFT_809019 [Macrolepiota fuliginosa MF-IS2]|uniref:Transmembrane protein n=1 Tax=Macrolepiota fuliginosa MF-IS2 TaxID=1400762 RepID=A0A9P5XK25_9AGAR|nr:hypothetical protein P691DRAFT_809019 [Macrolepiota fuliginosa MF-IS2]
MAFVPFRPEPPLPSSSDPIISPQQLTCVFLHYLRRKVVGKTHTTTPRSSQSTTSTQTSTSSVDPIETTSTSVVVGVSSTSQSATGEDSPPINGPMPNTKVTTTTHPLQESTSSTKIPPHFTSDALFFSTTSFTSSVMSALPIITSTPRISTSPISTSPISIPPTFTSLVPTAVPGSPHSSTNLQVILPVSIVTPALVILVIVFVFFRCRAIRARRWVPGKQQVYPFSTRGVDQMSWAEATLSQPHPREKHSRSDTISTDSAPSQRIRVPPSEPELFLPVYSGPQTSDSSTMLAATGSGMSIPTQTSQGQRQPGEDFIMTIVHRVVAAAVEAGQVRAAPALNDTQQEDLPPDYVSRVDLRASSTRPLNVGSTL